MDYFYGFSPYQSIYGFLRINCNFQYPSFIFERKGQQFPLRRKFRIEGETVTVIPQSGKTVDQGKPGTSHRRRMNTVFHIFVDIVQVYSCGFDKIVMCFLM